MVAHVCVCVCEFRGPKAISGDSWKLGRSQPERQKNIPKTEATKRLPTRVNFCKFFFQG